MMDVRNAYTSAKLFISHQATVTVIDLRNVRLEFRVYPPIECSSEFKLRVAILIQIAMLSVSRVKVLFL